MVIEVLVVHQHIFFVCLSMQVAKTVQEFEVPGCFLLLTDIQGTCSKLTIYVSKSVNQKELCDGRTRVRCHAVLCCHATMFSHVLLIIKFNKHKQDDGRYQFLNFQRFLCSF